MNVHVKYSLIAKIKLNLQVVKFEFIVHEIVHSRIGAALTFLGTM